MSKLSKDNQGLGDTHQWGGQEGFRTANAGTVRCQASFIGEYP
jgi:hypothetical protein